MLSVAMRLFKSPNAIEWKIDTFKFKKSIIEFHFTADLLAPVKFGNSACPTDFYDYLPAHGIFSLIEKKLKLIQRVEYFLKAR